MLLHQDASRHEWVSGALWDLIVTMDDANGEHYAMFFVAEEGTMSSFRGVGEVIAKHGLFCSLYTDRGSHYWHTAEAGSKVDKNNLTQFGRAMHQLGIEMIAAYSPQARGRSERAFGTHQERLPKELAAAGIRTMTQANRYLAEVYLPAFNAEFMVPSTEAGSAFVPYIGANLEDILCEQFERTVGHDNCVRFERLSLQIPPILIAVTTSRHACECIVTATAHSRCFMARVSWLAMMHSACLLPGPMSRPPRRSAARDRARGKSLRATPSAPSPAHTINSGQFMCYRTGQFNHSRHKMTANLQSQNRVRFSHSGEHEGVYPWYRDDRVRTACGSLISGSTRGGARSYRDVRVLKAPPRRLRERAP